MRSLPPSPQVKIVVCRQPVNTRKRVDGPRGTVIDVVDEAPKSGRLFLFFNKRRSMIKVLVWEASGFWGLSKRLSQGRFQIFDRASSSRTSFELARHELTLPLEGIDSRGARRAPERWEVKRLVGI